MATRKPTKTLSKGTKVTWQTSQGKTTGTVIGKVTKTTKVKTHTAKASAAAPQIKVKTIKSGKTAIHKASSLKKTGK